MSCNNPGALYIVATPIGNLDDISIRALDTLKSVDAIAAEDTRHSQKLLNHFGIEKKIFPYHDHTNEKQLNLFLSRLRNGESVALISDAGTPLISDPGYRIVKLAREEGVRVVPVPGASATLSALCSSGLPTDAFSFEGFTPAKSSSRQKFFQQFSSESRTMVFFESPHRIEASLSDAVDIFGVNRPATMAREITKSFETFLGSTLGEILEQVRADANQRRGEIVLVIAGVEKQPIAEDMLTIDVAHLLTVLCEQLPTKQASSIASELTGLSKKVLYQRALSLKAN